MTKYDDVLDERQLDAVRFSRRVMEIWRGSAQSEEDWLRFAIFLMYLRFFREDESTWYQRNDVSLSYNPAYTNEIDPGRLERLRREVAEQLHIPIPNFLDIGGEPLGRIIDLFHAVNESAPRDALLYRFDRLCELLWAKGGSYPNGIKLERFVAAFAQRWVSRPGVVLDGNPLTSGELGTRFGIDELEYLVLADVQPHALELILKLFVHGVRFGRVGTPSLFIERDPRTIHSFLFPVLGNARSAPQFRKTGAPESWRKSGHDALDWFVERAAPNQRAVILFGHTELKARGWREHARSQLLAGGVIHGVLELPTRVSARVRYCLMVVRKPFPGDRADKVVFVDGRALDGLQDESLDRLAQFLSIPFSALDPSRGGGIWDGWREDLGQDLEQRASKMFFKSDEPIPGFMTVASVGEVLDFHAHSLVPEDVIPRRDTGGPSAFLDGAVIRHLLRGERYGSKCIYIIGDNGAGKSFLLKELAEVLVAQERPVRVVSSALTDRFTTAVPAGSDYLYLGGRANGASQQARKPGPHMMELLMTIYRDRDRVDLFNSVAESIRFQGRHYLMPTTTRTDLFEKVVEFESGLDQPDVRGMKLGLMKTNSSTILPFDHLSSGEQQVLLLIAKLVANAGYDAVFLVDEPETSLHVAWQRALPNILRSVSRYFACDIVIATHSPVLISAATEASDHRFSAQGGMLEPIDADAASGVERVLFEGFGTYTVNNREVHERCAELVAKAVDKVNSGRTEELGEVELDLAEMEETIKRSVPVLGEAGTSRHLDLIRRARSVMESLKEEAPRVGQGGVNG